MGDGDGRALRCAGLAVSAQAGERNGMQPAAFNEANDLMGVARDNGSAALSALHFMAEEKKLAFGLPLVERSGKIFKDISGGLIFARSIESVGILEMRGTKSFDQQVVADGGLLRSEGQKSHLVLVFAGAERIWGGTENGDIVDRVCGDYGDFYETRRGFGKAQQDLRLAAVAEFAEDVCGSEQIAVIVDEEGVAVKDVVKATLGGS